MILTSILIIIFSIFILMVRLLIGPLIEDRIVTADALSVTLAMLFVIFSVLLNNPYFLDICLIYSMLSFVDILIMAKYLEDGELHK